MADEVRHDTNDESPENERDLGAESDLESVEEVTVVLPDDADGGLGLDVVLPVASAPDSSEPPAPEAEEAVPGRGEGLRDEVSADDAFGGPIEFDGEADEPPAESPETDDEASDDSPRVLGLDELNATVVLDDGEMASLGLGPTAPGELGAGLPGPGERRPPVAVKRPGGSRERLPTVSVDRPPASPPPPQGDSEEADLGVESVDEDFDFDGEDTEEVFVILPETMDEEIPTVEDIPVVETEAVDDIEDFIEGGVTEVVDESLLASIEPEPAGGADEGYDAPTEFASEDDFEGPTEVGADEDYEGPTEIVDDEEFEQLATELDDAVLVDDDGELYDRDDEFGDLTIDVAAEGEVVRPRRGWLVGTSVAAAAAVAFCGFYFWDGIFGSDEAAASQRTVATSTETPGGTAGSGDGTAATVEPVAAPDVREVLRERLTIALNRGFQVEVNE